MALANPTTFSQEKTAPRGSECQVSKPKTRFRIIARWTRRIGRCWMIGLSSFRECFFLVLVHGVGRLVLCFVLCSFQARKRNGKKCKACSVVVALTVDGVTFACMHTCFIPHPLQIHLIFSSYLPFLILFAPVSSFTFPLTPYNY